MRIPPTVEWAGAWGARLGILAAALCAFTGCNRGASTEAAWLAFDWPAADSLFQRDGSWVGADRAYSVDLGDGRDGRALRLIARTPQ